MLHEARALILTTLNTFRMNWNLVESLPKIMKAIITGKDDKV